MRRQRCAQASTEWHTVTEPICLSPSRTCVGLPAALTTHILREYDIVRAPGHTNVTNLAGAGG